MRGRGTRPTVAPDSARQNRLFLSARRQDRPDQAAVRVQRPRQDNHNPWVTLVSRELLSSNPCLGLTARRRSPFLLSRALQLTGSCPHPSQTVTCLASA